MRSTSRVTGTTRSPDVPPPGGGAAPVGRRVRLLPAALLAAGVILNLSTSPHLTFLGLFIAAPLIAAAIDTPRVTLVTTLVSLTISTLLLTTITPPPQLSLGERITLVGTAVAGAVLALLVNVVVVRGRQRVASAFGIAETVQRAVGPTPPTRVGPLRAAAHYRAAQHEALIGGDLYAAADTPFGARLIVGDVSGKGLGAAAAVAVVLGAFREWAHQEPDLLSLSARVEQALLRENKSLRLLDPDEGFVTAVLTEIRPRTRYRMTTVCHGHPPPLLLPPGSAPRYLPVPENAPPLGLGTGSRRPDKHLCTSDFPPGAFLLLYTDGVTEARDGHGTFYDPSTSLRDRVFDDPDALVDAVIDDVLAHTGGNLHDDTAVLAVQHPGDAPDPGDMPEGGKPAE
ncbi:PP2C family protein-serine/threonine phosphatase [Streptomyces sp. NPDC127098]|uniref:PP2C family protein-serine/threonine phosphatase n=1 Tax=Streptomyces sp. NPDC127098 TaxID=3347137 RepID=UPI0036679C10